jgi:WD40 repeat protein
MSKTRQNLAKMHHEKREYLLGGLPLHLAQSGQTDRLRAILSDFNFLYAKLELLGQVNLLEDFSIVYDPSLEPIKKSLSRAAHILAKSPEHLAGQLTARLDKELSPTVKTLLDGAHNMDNALWLRSLYPTMQSQNKALVRSLVGHTGTILCMAMSADGKHLVSGGLDGTLRMWDLSNTELIYTKKLPLEQADLIKDRKFSSAGWIGGLRDPEAGERGALGPIDLALSNDLKYVVIAIMQGRSALIWNLQTNKLVARLTGHEMLIYTVAITSDGSRAVTAGIDGAVGIWDLRKIKNPKQDGRIINIRPEKMLIAHKDIVNSVVISKDNRTVISASQDKSIRIWDIESGRLRRTFHTGKDILKLTVSFNNNIAVISPKDAPPEVWEIGKSPSWRDRLTRKKCLHTLSGFGPQAAIICIDDNAEQAVLAGTDGSLQIWDIVHGKHISTLAYLTDNIFCIAPTPDWRTIFTGSADQNIRIWDMQAAKEDKASYKPRGGIRSLAFLPKKDQFFSGNLDGEIKLWDLSKKDLYSPFSAYTEAVTATAVMPNGKEILTGAKNGEIKLWDLETGEEIQSYHEHKQRINGLSLTEDGRFVVSCSRDFTLRLWDLREKKRLNIYTDFAALPGALVMDRKGKHVLITLENGEFWRFELNIMQIYGADRPIEAIFNNMISTSLFHDGKLTSTNDRMKKCLANKMGRINALVISHDNRFAVLGGMDGRLLIWDVVKEEVSKELQTTGSVIWSLALAEEAEPLLWVASADHLALWDLTENTLKTRFYGDTEFLSCALSLDGSLLAAGDRAGQVHFFEVAGT